MGIIMLMVLVASLVWDEEEWQWQALMPVAISRVVLEQHHHELGKSDGAPAWKHWTFIAWNNAQARESVQEDYWGPIHGLMIACLKEYSKCQMQIADDLLNTCAASGPFFQLVYWLHG
jgi:hypothetical protein